jgi:NAD(P)H-flavin reductase
MNATVAVSPMLLDPYRITRVTEETNDTFTLELSPADGRSRFSYEAGQFNMVYVFGVGEIPISISGDPTVDGALVHTIRAVGTVTKVMHRLKKGGVLGIRGPYGRPWPMEHAEGADVVIVAGGIGLAPLRPALYHVLSRREKFGKVVLLYGTRSPEDILFRNELELWRSRFDLDVFVTVDHALRPWKGNVGVVTTLIPKAPFDPQSAVAMICGPEVMMRYTALELHKRGVPEDDIFISMERNMECGVGLCGHCQFGPTFVCKDGPVLNYSRIKQLIAKREM